MVICDVLHVYAYELGTENIGNNIKIRDLNLRFLITKIKDDVVPHRIRENPDSQTATYNVAVSFGAKIGPSRVLAEQRA